MVDSTLLKWYLDRPTNRMSRLGARCHERAIRVMVH